MIQNEQLYKSEKGSENGEEIKSQVIGIDPLEIPNPEQDIQNRDLLHESYD